MVRWFLARSVSIVVLAAVITPTGDVITQSIFAVPMVLLYLLGVAVSWLFAPNKKSEEDS